MAVTLEGNSIEVLSVLSACACLCHKSSSGSNVPLTPDSGLFVFFCGTLVCAMISLLRGEDLDIQCFSPCLFKYG